VKPKAFIFDIDGTVALRGDRGVFDFDDCAVDTRCNTAYALYKALVINYPIVFLTGREDKHRAATEKWLDYNGFGERVGLHMRPTGNNEPDQEVKIQTYQTYVEPHYDIVGLIDDRQRVVDAYRELGLTVLQIRPGNF
jgi:hypothetical protein